MKIKNILKSFFIVALLLTAGSSFSQTRTVELTPFAGYQFGGTMKFYEGKIRVDNALNYGVAIDVDIRYGVKAGFFYSRMDTKASWNPYLGYESFYPPASFDVAVNYFQVGTVKEFMQDKIKPFGTFTLGATWFDPSGDISDQWYFSVSLGAGVKIFFTERIGIRLQGRFLMPMTFSGVGLYAGVGSGGVSTGLGASAWSVIAQGDLTGGLIFVIGK